MTFKTSQKLGLAGLLVLGCVLSEGPARADATSNGAPSGVSGSDVSFQVTDIQPATNAPSAGFDPDLFLPPAWAFGVLHGYYTNQQGILDNLNRLESGRFPVDAVWVDSAFWDLSTHGPKGYLDFIGDTNAFPDLRRLTSALENKQVRFGIWVWDRILDANREVYEEFESAGYFKPGRIVSNGWHNVALTSVARIIDFSNPAAAELWMQRMRPFLEAGVDFIKMDAGPQTDYLRTQFELTQKHGRHTKGRGFVLTQAGRDSLADIKRYPAAWTGDAQASWHQPDYPDTGRWILGGLRQQIEMVSNPTWRHYQYPFLANDTGGFHPRLLEGKAAEELYIRWAQFSAFGSMMQVFGAPKVPFQNAPFGWPEYVQDNFRRHTHLRLRLFPYIYSEALRMRLDGVRLIRGDADHPMQYRFGDAFLVAPVYEPGAAQRSVWLPEGEGWIDYWTGESHAGGRQATVPAPLEHLPLLVRAGSIIPMRDYAPSVLRGSNRVLTLDVYPPREGGSGMFTLYEDDGSSLDYLTNGFAATRIVCRSLPGQVALNIGKSVGQYAGKPDGRKWKLQMHLSGRPSQVQLDGKALEWRFDAAGRVLLAEWETGDTTQPATLVIRL